jgi:hypothetical protein
MTVEPGFPFTFWDGAVELVQVRQRLVDDLVNEDLGFPTLVAVLHGPKQVRAFRWSHAISIEIAVDLVPFQQRAAEQTLP